MSGVVIKAPFVSYIKSHWRFFARDSTCVWDYDGTTLIILRFSFHFPIPLIIMWLIIRHVNMFPLSCEYHLIIFTIGKFGAHTVYTLRSYFSDIGAWHNTEVLRHTFLTVLTILLLIAKGGEIINIIAIKMTFQQLTNNKYVCTWCYESHR